MLKKCLAEWGVKTFGGPLLKKSSGSISLTGGVSESLGTCLKCCALDTTPRTVIKLVWRRTQNMHF